MDNKVLIVEDDESISELISIHLKDLNCEVTSENNGLNGLNTALEDKFDLIILDINLPGKDGLDICRELRASKIKTPILMLTDPVRRN